MGKSDSWVSALYKGTSLDGSQTRKSRCGNARGGLDGIPPTFHPEGPSGASLTLEEAKKKLGMLVKQTPFHCTNGQSEKMTVSTNTLIARQPKEQREALLAHLKRLLQERTAKSRKIENRALAEMLAVKLVETKPCKSKQQREQNHS